MTLRDTGAEMLRAAMDLYDAAMAIDESITGLYPDCVKIHINAMQTAFANFQRAIHREERE